MTGNYSSNSLIERAAIEVFESLGYASSELLRGAVWPERKRSGVKPQWM
jgi:hypothetical protein